jgi:diguanylate cyclase (GGDEF)-like protein
MEPTFSWLCPTPGSRERFLDMQERLRLPRTLTIVAGVLTAAAVAHSAKAGWTVLGATTLMIAVVLIGAWRVEQRKRPELWIYASTVVNIQVMLALGIVLTGGPRTLLVSTLVVPVVMVGARFSNRGLAVGAPTSALLIVATTLGVDPEYVAAQPESLVVPLVLVMVVTVYLSALVASDVRHRAESTLDQLTGLLNRRGLDARFAEVAEQAALTDEPVSVVVGDIDHFKLVNDRHGHGVGDAVLRDVARAMRANLRSFELLYRLGGEEFLLLLPGANAEEAAEIAEKLRFGVEDLRPEGLYVTCSFGVATSDHSHAVLATLLGTADAALYRAKHDGRNRVETPASALTLAL